MASTNQAPLILLLEKLDCITSNLILIREDVILLKKDITEIKKELNAIKTSLNDVTPIMKDLDKSAVKLNDHIDKIDSIYDTVKTPFHKAMNMINWASSRPECIDDESDEFASALLLSHLV